MSEQGGGVGGETVGAVEHKGNGLHQFLNETCPVLRNWRLNY